MRVAYKQLQLVGSLAVAYSGTSIALDVGAYNEFVIGKLTGNVDFSFLNAAVGQRGSIWVKADAVGNWRVGFTAPATFLIAESSTSVAEADLAANAMARITYAMHALDGQNYIEIDRTDRVVAVKVVTYNGATVKVGSDRLITS